MKRDRPEPITDEHTVFARELVALARKHGADLVQVDFRLTGGRRMFEEQYDPTRVSFSWHEGRHGEPAQFTLRAEAEIYVDEMAENEA